MKKFEEGDNISLRETKKEVDFVKIISLKCPECKADLSINEEREFCFCQYCGTKILLQNENEFIYRNIDEAKVKQAETERLIRIREIELEDKKRQSDEKTKEFKIIISIAIGIVILIFVTVMGILRNLVFGLPVCFGAFAILYIWMDESERKEVVSKCVEMLQKKDCSKSQKQEKNVELIEKSQVLKIKIPTSVWENHSNNYAVIEAELIEAGFKNVRSIPLCDLKLGLFSKPGEVSEITFAGKPMNSSFKRKYPENVSIIISYHSFEKR